MTNFIITHLYPVLFTAVCASAAFGALMMGVLAANGRMDHCDKCIALRKYIGTL